jgi:DNA sulfur modification protein DndD
LDFLEFQSSKAASSRRTPECPNHRSPDAPVEFATLVFFFDAEKIRTLAEDETSSQVLGAAVKSLLGLDVVERLIADAAVVQARIAGREGPAEVRAEVEAIKGRIAALQAEVEGLVLEQGSLQNALLRAREERRKAEDAFASSGGRHWEERQERERTRAALKAQLAALESQLVALADGELPLVLVSEWLDGVAQQDERERQAVEARVTGQLLEDRDQTVLEVLREERANARILSRLEALLAADRARRAEALGDDARLELSPRARALLQHLSGPRLGELRG